MTVKTCYLCAQPLPARRRKYCPSCAGEARRLWKREQRRANHGSPYWLDHWVKQTGDLKAAREAYNEYMRTYMQRYRQRKNRDPTVSHGSDVGRQRSSLLAA
jgi:hypothetical protein